MHNYVGQMGFYLILIVCLATLGFGFKHRKELNRKVPSRHKHQLKSVSKSILIGGIAGGLALSFVLPFTLPFITSQLVFHTPVGPEDPQFTITEQIYQENSTTQRTVVLEARSPQTEQIENLRFIAFLPGCSEDVFVGGPALYGTPRDRITLLGNCGEAVYIESMTSFEVASIHYDFVGAGGEYGNIVVGQGDVNPAEEGHIRVRGAYTWDLNGQTYTFFFEQDVPIEKESSPHAAIYGNSSQ